MKTQEEILVQIEKLEPDDFFGHQRSDLLNHLDFENARPFLKEGMIESQWKKETKSPKKLMIDYMAFAWEKALGHRGLSASRSMDHYTAWLWLDGDETLRHTLADYTDYGKPQLVEICEYLGIDPEKYKDS
jgi:hypothetical protein